MRLKAINYLPIEKGLREFPVLFQFEGFQAKFFWKLLERVSFHDGLRMDLGDPGRWFRHRRFPDVWLSRASEEEEDHQIGRASCRERV